MKIHRIDKRAAAGAAPAVEAGIETDVPFNPTFPDAA